MLTRSFVSEIRRMLKLFWPIILGQLAVNSMSVVDTVMAGMAGPLQLSGVAIGASFFYPVLFTMVGLSLAIQPIISHLLGGGKKKDVSQQMHQITITSLVISVFMAVFLSQLHLVYNFIPADPEMIRVATGYLYALSLGIPVMVLYNVLRAYCEGLGITTPTLWFGFLQLALNIPLNYIFIFGKLGLPALGGIGCGVATALTSLIATIVFLIYVEISPRFKDVRLFRKLYALDKNCIKQFLKLGIPLALSSTMEVTCFSLAALILSPFGPIVVSAHSITLNISGMLFMLPLSVAIVTTIRVGYFMGSHNFDRAIQTTKAGFCINLFFYLISVVFLLNCRHFLASLYTDNTEIIDMASSLLLINCLYLLPDSIQMLSIGVLRGFKDSKTIFFVTLVAYWVIGMPLGASLAWGIFTEKMHAYGIWIGFICALSVAMIIYVIRLAILFKTRRLPKALRA